MERRNVTLSLPRDLLQKVKVQAAMENKSLSGFAAEALEERIRRITGYDEAMRKHLGILSAPSDLGTRGKLKVRRDALHERG